MARHVAQAGRREARALRFLHSAAPSGLPPPGTVTLLETFTFGAHFCIVTGWLTHPCACLLACPPANPPSSPPAACLLRAACCGVLPGLLTAATSAQARPVDDCIIGRDSAYHALASFPPLPPANTPEPGPCHPPPLQSTSHPASFFLSVLCPSARPAPTPACFSPAERLYPRFLDYIADSLDVPSPLFLHHLRKLAHQLLSTLAFMHMHHLVHGDLKPDNILMQVGGDGLAGGDGWAGGRAGGCVHVLCGVS